MTNIRTYTTSANRSRVNYVYTAPTEEQDRTNLAICERKIEKFIAEMKKATTKNEYYDAQQSYNYWTNLRLHFM